MSVEETMRTVLIRGAQRYRDGEITMGEFEQGLILAIAESPYGPEKQEDLKWLAVKLTSKS